MWGRGGEGFSALFSIISAVSVAVLLKSKIASFLGSKFSLQASDFGGWGSGDRGGGVGGWWGVWGWGLRGSTKPT